MPNHAMRAGDRRRWWDRWLVRLNPLDAPRGYRWEDEDVQYEKVDSFLTGLLVGIVVSTVLTVLAMVMAS